MLHLFLRRTLPFPLPVSHCMAQLMVSSPAVVDHLWPLLWCVCVCVCVCVVTAEELSATDEKTDTEKADMRIVQAAAQEVTETYTCVHSFQCVYFSLRAGLNQAQSHPGARSAG